MKINTYIDKIIDKDSFTRVFSENLEEKELVWHRDPEDRIIEIVSGDDWSFQRDNCLPEKIISGCKIHVNKNEWHRIIKGNTDLKVIIHKFKCNGET